MFNATVLADSRSSVNQSRLTTMELRYPRCIHSEFMTHRRFSRNAASSRAIPIEKMIEAVTINPFIPHHWGKNQPGMQANEEVDIGIQGDCVDVWLNARADAVIHAQRLHQLGIHKQIVNRLLEPWMWITIICSGTEDAWANFFALRCHHMAEPHLNILANLARRQYEDSTPVDLAVGQWHLPLFGFEGDDLYTGRKQAEISAARCARVSYLTHAGKRDVQADLDLFQRLAGSRPIHASALEHQAMCIEDTEDMVVGGNFGRGWYQFRKMIPGEAVDRMKDVLPIG